MKVLLAPDKFKGSLSAVEVCRAMAEGINLYDPEIETVHFPLADGGDGTSEILTYHAKGHMVTCPTLNPLFKPIEGSYGISGDKKTAFIELAQASGLHLLAETERNPMFTSTYGTGLLILDAINKGVEKIILGIGGSATNDGGLGLAAALGYTFIDKGGQELHPVGKNLSNLYCIQDARLLFDPDKITIEVACDVRNPLFGPNGAAFVYAPQKGANSQEVEHLDAGLRQFDKVVTQDLGIAIAGVSGAGAAGGAGGGAVAFLNARLIPGIELVMEATNFGKALKGTDLILTGEGKIDKQTKEGKVVAGVSQKAKEHQIPVAAISGILELDTDELLAIGVKQARDLISLSKEPETAIKDAYRLVKELSNQMIEQLLH
ncbi:MAG: glycerate kinase [Cyclobacteriaceae bacterium]